MKGRIERIFENKKKDGNKYWVLLIDGERYSVWDQALMENLNERYFVEFEYSSLENTRI